MSFQFLGEYTCKLDNKGRFRIPTPLLKQLHELAKEGFVLNRGFEQCLVLYPTRTWKGITQELEKLNMYVKKNRDFVRYFFRGASQLEVDKQNRLLVPKSLQTYAALKNEIILFSYFNRIEIWSSSKYEELLMNEPSDFGDLAEEVMGNFYGKSDYEV
ncbi:MAG: division/cell wall cluster transcriptional repressor MraZ [Saprospiraceae bacterium]|nr:division/cell wall cluster transcriptional repressor MraZ [Saprospiraceae bacterium]